MASPADLRAITNEHRVAQVAATAPLLLESQAAWSLLDIDALDATAPRWAAAQLALLRAKRAISSSLAARYLSDFRTAAIGTRSGMEVVAPPLDELQARTMLRVSGPIAVKNFIAGGREPLDAYRTAGAALAGRSQEWALNGGRSAVQATVHKDPVARGWRRVSSGRPCAFCAMLVTRSHARLDIGGFKAHAHCGCSAEPYYTDSPSITDEEWEWMQAYEQAAEQARAAGEAVRAPSRRSPKDTVLWRMRRNRPDLFSDGVHAH